MVPNFSFGAGKDCVAERNVLWGSKLCGGGGRGKLLLCSSGPVARSESPHHSSVLYPSSGLTL